MKAIEIEYEYYQYPDGITNLKQFAEYLNNSNLQFIELVRFIDDNCREPLTRAEYECRLEKIVEEKCTFCSNYHGGSKDENLEGHRSNINLDGNCPFYEKSE